MIKLTDQEFAEFTQYVHKRYGINLARKRVLIEGRLSNTLVEMGLSNFKQYLELLKADQSGEQTIKLLNKITTNHTFFMRENNHFTFMEQHALPFLEKNKKDHDLRIWSAGCSSGQEAYTIAMLLDTYFGNRKQLWDTKILATDISMAALEKGRAAIYPTDSLDAIPLDWRQKYFKDLNNGTVQLADRLKKEVIFRPFNLMDPFHFKKPFDLIFCRNVMIYFDEETKASLVNKFYQAAAPGSFLFVGHSEVINRQATNYRYIKPAIYQKGGE
jgi:chemotaxis protein methyltransferase CheR